ncbi:YhgE/Pip family protein [Vagococcus jeotgali]|uniref:YhgE/Pip family protein n=1 Tax=Vagococcus jeotgali TaxID=3109030 RepID=UPI002DD88178|nr:YhgE/Pip family protein [Vagococcus sp. B2T-5]
MKRVKHIKTVKEEFKKMTSNKTLLISVIVIILIPMLAASVLGKSMWNPTDLSKNLPVAVVNEDKNVEMMGTKVNVGEQLVANLKDNKDLKWEFVSKEEAEKGMKDLCYYMTITFPENLSKDVTTLFDPNPTPLEIIYSTNGSLSYLGSVVGTVAASTIESQLRENITEQYLDAVVKAGGEAVKEIPTVLDGVDQLPGGYTPPERFVRAAFFKEHTNQAVNEIDGVSNAYHILATVRIPKGVVVTPEKQEDYSLYVGSMCNESRTYYYNGYDNNQIAKATITDELLEKTEPVIFAVDREQTIKDLQAN